MKTLTLEEAAEFLHIHPVTLTRKAIAGDVPGRKIGRCWIFIDVDLVDCIRAGYVLKTSGNSCNEQKESPECPSPAKQTPRTTGLISPSKDNEYASLLGLPTAKRRKSTTTS